MHVTSDALRSWITFGCRLSSHIMCRPDKPTWLEWILHKCRYNNILPKACYAIRTLGRKPHRLRHVMGIVCPVKVILASVTFNVCLNFFEKHINVISATFYTCHNRNISETDFLFYVNQIYRRNTNWQTEYGVTNSSTRRRTGIRTAISEVPIWYPRRLLSL